MTRFISIDEILHRNKKQIKSEPVAEQKVCDVKPIEEVPVVEANLNEVPVETVNEVVLDAEPVVEVPVISEPVAEATVTEEAAPAPKKKSSKKKAEASVESPVEE